MEKRTLSEEAIVPDDALIFSIIKDKQIVWKEMMAYLYGNNTDINQVWKYYRDGKSWLLRVLKKKKTIFWVNILDDTFQVAFYFVDRLEPEIIKSKLSDDIKKEYLKAKRWNKSRCISIDVAGLTDLPNIKELIDLRVRLK